MLIYGKELVQWAAQRLANKADFFDDSAVAIGVSDGGKILASVVYTDYRDEISIEMSIVSVDKKWATRHNLKAFFAYPFTQLKLKRVQAVTSVHNEGVISMLERLGFKREGLHRCAYWNGDDAYSYGMLSHECGWL